MPHEPLRVGRPPEGQGTLDLEHVGGQLTAHHFYEAIGFVRLADIVRHDGTALRSYGLTLLPAPKRR